MGLCQPGGLCDAHGLTNYDDSELECDDAFPADLSRVMKDMSYGGTFGRLMGRSVAVKNRRLVAFSASNQYGGMGSDFNVTLVGPLPRSIGGCSELLVLELRNCNLQGELPQELQQCQKLKELDLSENSISLFPQWLGSLAGLEKLEICNNEVPMSGGVPAAMNGLRKLRTLSLFRAQVKGGFGPMELFTRMSQNKAAELVLCGNCFDSVDFGGQQFTDGILRNYNPAKSMCIASFCGAEFLEWRKLLHRADNFRDWSQLCVFLSAYATAQKTNICDPSWHAGGCKDSPECRRLGRFFNMAAKATNNASISSHDQFGCKWFEKWCGNIEAAIRKGHTRLLVFTKPDMGIGTCQQVEWCFLQDLCRQHRHLKLNACNVADLDTVLQMGVKAYDEMHFPEWLDFYDRTDTCLAYILKQPGSYCREDARTWTRAYDERREAEERRQSKGKGKGKGKGKDKGKGKHKGKGKGKDNGKG